MVTSAHERLLARLMDTLGNRSVLAGGDRIRSYRSDRAGEHGVGTPLAVVLPETQEEVQSVVRIAAAAAVPIVPRGAGSGLSGGSAAVDGCVVISLERMRDIRIDADLRIAVAQPGALTGDVKARATEHGLWYPPDPSSFEFSSIGGNVATNAGGLCCVKYGVTSDYVLGLTVVLADGRAVKLGGPRLKDVAGLSLTKLFVGSEGTLGIITEVVLRLVPARQSPATLVATFASLEEAARAVLGITRSVRPSMLEFMDRVSINAVEDIMRAGLDRTAAAMLMVQSDEPTEHATAEIAAIEECCRDHGATECFVTNDPDEGEALVSARRLVLPAVERRGSVLLEDTGVPVGRLGDLIAGITRIGVDRGVEIAVVAHAGDGNAHPLIVFDPSDTSERAQAELAFGDIMELALTLGGTITGEHGVGRLKQPWLARQLGDDAMELNARIKSAFDPDGLLNPGAMFTATPCSS